jgi:hypothetical protein
MNIEQLEKRIISDFGVRPLSTERIHEVEQALNIKFPELFIRLNELCSYEHSNFGFFYFGGDDIDSVIETTLGVRENYENSENFAVLYLDDAGIVLLNVADENASVTWCSVYDMENVFNNTPLSANHQFFPTFADFFNYLLDEEEAERSEKETIEQ